MARRIRPEDLTWLLMDRPNNLMHTHGLLAFDEGPTLEALTDTVMDHMVRKFRRLSQIPVQIDGIWHWDDDTDFAIERHVTHHILDDLHPDTVRAHVSAQFSRPFDRTHPIWEMQLITGPATQATHKTHAPHQTHATYKSYVLGRFHHGLGDGIRMVQMIIGACAPVDGATPQAVGRNLGGEHHHPLEQALHFVEDAATDTLDYVTAATKTLTAAGRELITTTNPLGLAQHIGDALDLVRHPVKLVDAITSIAAPDNDLTNSFREINRMLFSDGHDAQVWSGHAGIDKRVSWLESFPLDGLKDAAQAHECTLNDILMAAVSLAMTDYLESRGGTDVSDLSWMMPVSLRPIDGTLPATLGNKFAVVMLSMPLGIRDHATLIDEIHERTTRIKHSAEPIAAFGFQRIIAESPAEIARSLTNYFADKTIGQLSNVPGPRVALTFAGAPITAFLGWTPTSGDQPIGVCLFSYDGAVSIGVATDTRMIPDPDHLIELIETHLAELSH